MKARLSSQSGFGLLEVLVAATVMMTVLYAITQMMVNQYKSTRALRGATEYHQLIGKIARYSGMGGAIARSAGRLHDGSTIASSVVNEPFRRCVLGIGPSGSCAAGEQAFELTDPAGTVIAATTPILYDLNGAVCTVAGPRCPYQARVWFTPECPGGTYPCPIAQRITIRYEVRQIAGVNVDGGVTMPTTGNSIASIIPLAGYVNGSANRMAMWTSSTELQVGNIAQTADNRIEINPGGAGYGAAGLLPSLAVTGRAFVTQTFLLAPGGGGVAQATADCHVFATGSLRNNGGTIEVCDGATWRWATGPINSSRTVGFGPANKFPRMPGLYVCPQGGQVGQCESAGRGPICQGQISQYSTCCMNPGDVTHACDPLD